jgi:3'-phosphoadenosine 5'-phosphosulfate sulfotransferase (PAPS reductase)/FAD synthetase
MQKIKKDLEEYIKGKKSAFLFTGDKGSALLISVIKDIGISIIFIDTGYQFNEIIDYINSLGSKIEIIKNSNASIDYTSDMSECCYQRKTKALKEYLDKTNAECLIVPFIDEERNNGIEDSYLNGINNIKIIRPISDLTERDVWIRIKEYKLPFSPIYNKGYRFVDCKCCTTRLGRGKYIEEDKNGELDKETEERLKALGYM